MVLKPFQDIECIFQLKFNLNTFFAIFDFNNDQVVERNEVLEFGKRRIVLSLEIEKMVIVCLETSLGNILKLETRLTRQHTNKVRKVSIRYFSNLIRIFPS